MNNATRRQQRRAMLDALQTPTIESLVDGVLEGHASPFSTVRVVEVASGALLGLVVTDPDGAWSINGIAVPAAAMLIAYAHDDAGHVKNSSAWEAVL